MISATAAAGSLNLTERQILCQSSGPPWQTDPLSPPPPSGAQPLAGVRIVECSMLGPGAITTQLADLGADVIKVEPPDG